MCKSGVNLLFIVRNPGIQWAIRSTKCICARSRWSTWKGFRIYGIKRLKGYKKFTWIFGSWILPSKYILLVHPPRIKPTKPSQIYPFFFLFRKRGNTKGVIGLFSCTIQANRHRAHISIPTFIDHAKLDMFNVRGDFLSILLFQTNN